MRLRCEAHIMEEWEVDESLYDADQSPADIATIERNNFEQDIFRITTPSAAITVEVVEVLPV